MDFIINHYNLIMTTISININIFFTYLVLFKSSKGIGEYRKILAITGIFEIFYSSLIVISNQLLFITSDVFIVYMKPGAFFEKTPFAIYVMAIKFSCIALTYGILEIHFIYRYIAICRPHLMPKLSFDSTKIMLFIYVFLHGAIAFYLYCFVLKCDDETRILFEDAFLQNTDLSIHDRPMICLTVTKGSSIVRFRGYLAETFLYTLSIYSTSVYILLGILIIREFRLTKMSLATIKLQKRLTIALIVQTIIPVVTNFIPTILSWSWPILQLSPSVIAWRSIQFFIALFPILDPIAIILILPEYRKAAQQFLKCQSSTLNSSTVDVKSRSRQSIIVVPP